MATSSKPQDPTVPVSPEMAPSKPLQIFLLAALVISGAAYVTDECNQLFAPRHIPPDRLHRLVESRSEYAAHLHDALLAARNKQYEVAVAQFRLALQAQNSAEGHYNMALALLKVARPDEAMAQFREAATLNPHYTDVYLAWGEAQMEEGKPEGAIAVFRDALRNSPNSSLAHLGLAQALIQQEKDALADQRVAEAQDNSPEAVAQGAKVERLRTDALQHLAQAKRLGLDRAEFWFNYGQLLNEQQNFAEAEPYLRMAATEKPEMADAHFALGVAESHLANESDAVAQFQAALTLRKDDPPALERLARIYATTTNLDLRSPKMAIALATRANDAVTSQNPRYLDTLARSYAADGDFAQALEWEDKAIHRAEQVHDAALARELHGHDDLFQQRKTQ